jgi:LPS O-antigen subunit length determinant protein (WzzB/FepE family)
MIYRKSLAQVKFRLRKELLNKIKRAAERNDRPMTEEIAALLEDAFDQRDWQAERLTLLTALELALENNPQASAIRAQLTEIGGRGDWRATIVQATKRLKPIPPAVAGETESEDNLPSTGEVGRPQHHRTEKEGKAG